MAPAPSFKCSHLGGLYEPFYKHWELAPPRDLSNRFEVLFDEVIRLVPCLAEPELFESS
nr:ClbS/DfsB family four-helix bundle protein [Corynebacterium amycolatum]